MFPKTDQFSLNYKYVPLYKYICIQSLTKMEDLKNIDFIYLINNNTGYIFEPLSWLIKGKGNKRKSCSDDAYLLCRTQTGKTVPIFRAVWIGHLYKVFRLPKTLFIQGVCFYCRGSLLVCGIASTNSEHVQ